MKRIVLLLILVVTSHVYSIGVDFELLTCNSQQNPIAIQGQHPLLSWVVKADGFNRSQTAYQILVSSNPDLLNEKDADLWNSGKVSSSQSANVKYRGLELLSTQKYWWKVKIWDEKGNSSDWSPANSFETGLFEEASWGNSKWISLKKDDRQSEYRFRGYQTGGMDEPLMVTSQPVGYFRNELLTDKQIESARAYICGLGYYELYINGEKTGDHVLDPAPSNYDKQTYYVTYDVTSQLKKGKNAIGVILGNGFYGQTISWKNDPESERDMSYGAPAARLLVKLTYADGSKDEFYSDENWRASTGPIVFDNVYGGDTYDARYEIQGWNTAGFNDEKWEGVKLVSPDVTKASAQEMPPIRRLKELEPTYVFKSPDTGKWIVDFGQNIAGWVQITVNEKEGQLIEIVPTEALTQSGDNIFPGSTGGGANGMPQLLQYICKGGGPETWEPKFSYHGFRYAEVSGFSVKPDANSIKAVLVATDVAEKGSFVCSDPLLNKMDTISRWTIVDNLHGIPEDCPHREKCGWLGDAHAFCEYALYNYDLGNFYKKYMEDIRTQMRPEKGQNSDEKFLVPTMIAPGKRTSSIAKLDWGVATMYLPWYNYVYSGDSSIVLDYYDDMKGLTNYYLTFKNEEGIIDNGMGDWCPPRWDRKQNPEAMECDPVVSANAYFYDILGIMEAFAEMSDDIEFRLKMQKEKTELFDAFNKAYLKSIPLVGHYWYGSQTATVMALQFGMVPEDKIESVVNGLAYDIVAEKGGHHSTGIHGNRYIYTVLSNYGKADLAHEILTTPTFPSQTYVMNYGFTTWPERQFFWDDMDGLTNSLNHPMHSGFAAYFFESLGGVKSSSDKPGFKEFVVNPIFPDAITQTTVNIPTPYGAVRNSWEIEDANFSMNLEVPFNTKARLVLSAEELESLKINGESWTAYQLKHMVESIGQSVVVLGSGKYKIQYLKEGQ
ncbi:family 78 glycoside hydrolase catalytic domain [Mangrovibacterium sp.]|uniref:family 78 glycoside hydrolase catalytic domain n=1 Tax=Mangrovibacterium sp. TaxID=1961364 RepID=UPI0035639606